MTSTLRLRVPLAIGVVLAAAAATFAFTISTAPPADAAGCYSTTLRVGSRGSCVAQLQRMIGTLHSDGAYGTNTANRVKAFQRDTGLSVDGITGPKTWNKLRHYGTSMGWKSGATIFLCKEDSIYLRWSVWNNTGGTVTWRFKTGGGTYHNGLYGVPDDKIVRHAKFANTARTNKGVYFAVSINSPGSFRYNYDVKDYTRAYLPACL